MQILEALWGFSLLLLLFVYHGRKYYQLSIPMSVVTTPALLLGILAFIFR